MDLHSLSATAWPDPQPSPAAAPGVSPALEPRADTDALARVQDETERVLDAVPRALQRLRRGAAPAEADPATVLQLSVRQMQQVAGALRITGFEQAARLPAAVAELLAKAAAQAGPPGVAVVEGVEHACAALRTYLRRWRAGRPLSALALYPAWSTLQTLSGAERIHPAELWPVPWQWHALPPDERMPPLQPDGATRGAAEQLTLALMRDARSVAASRLSDLFAALARGAADGRMATLWGLASALYEGQAKGLLAPEVHLKRVSSRLLAQLRRGPLGTADAVAQRLAHDLLFFCAQAGVQAQDGATPRLAGVRRTWGLERHPAVDVEHALPAGADAALLAQTLRQLAAVQALWDAAAAGTPRPGQREALSQMAQSLRQLLPRQAQAVEELTQTLQHVMAEPGVATSAVPALEVAQSLLALQLLLQEHETETAAEPLQRLSTRIAQALSGAPAETGHPEVPVDAWLLELAQRGAERQALTALGQSLRTALNEAGLQLDALAQGPDDATLRALAQRLQRLQGVLTVLSQPELASSLQALREALPAEASALDGAQAARLARRLARLDLACERLMLGLPPTEGLPRDEELDAMDAPAPASAPAATAATAVPEILTEAEAWAEPGLLAPPAAVSESAPAAAAAPVEEAAATPEPAPVAEAQALSEPVPAAGPGSDLSQAPQPPLLTERPELPALTEPALPPGVEANWDEPAAGLPALPELVDVTQPVTLHQAATDDEHVELASLLKHLDAQGAAMAPRVASPSGQAAAAPLSSRLVALSRLGGAPALPPVASEPVAAAPAESTVAEEPAQPHEDAGAQASTLPATWDEPAPAGEAAGPGAETAVAEAPSVEAAPVAEPPAEETPAAQAGADLPGEDDAVAAQLAVAAAEEPWPEADAPAAVARTEAPADAPPAAEEETLWSDTEARAWLDTEAGSWAEAAAGNGSEPDAGLAAVPPAQAPSAAAAGLPDGPQLPDLPDLSDLPGLPALPELPELPDGLPPAEDDGLAFDLSFDLPPAPQAPAFPLAAANEAFGGAEPPVEQEGADFDLDFGPGLPGTDTSPLAAADAEAEEEIFLDMGEPEEPPLAAGAPSVPADTAGLPGLANSGGEPAQQREAAAGEVRMALPDEALPPVEPDDAGFELDFDIDLPEAGTPQPAPAADVEEDAGAAPVAEAPAVLEPAPALEPIATAATLAPLEDEHRVVGPLRVQQSLFDIYIEEAEALSGRLHEKLWQWQPPQPLERELVVVTHALAGMAATVGDQALWQLARTLEDTMAPCRRPGYATPLMKQRQGEGVLRVREMLTLFASGTLPEPVEPAFLQYLRAPHEDVPAAQNPLGAPVEARNPFGPPPQSTKLELADEERAPLPDKEQGGPDATAGKVHEEGDEESLQWLDLSDAAEAPPAFTPAEAGMPADDVAPMPDLADAADETGEDFHETVPAGEPWGLLPTPVDAGAPASAAAQDDLQTLDPALFPVFEDEAQELLPQLAHSLSAWAEDGGEEHAAAGMRTLHTLKGGARLAGAMRLGDAAHALESAIEALLARSGLPERAEIEALLARADALAAEFERLRAATAPQAEGADAEIPPAWADAAAQAPAGSVAFEAAEAEAVTGEAAPEEEAADAPLPEAEPVAQAAVPALDESAVQAQAELREPGEPAIDWSRFAVEPPPLPPAAVAASPAATVRVRAPALDRLVAQAGEVGISRARLAAEMQQLGSSLADLDENLQRLRGQLREVEQQAETRLDPDLEAAPAFDALEMDRSTRLQELARMMAESLDDMASVQHSLRQGLRGTDDELVVLARLAGELQDELLRTRLVAFDSLAERLQRVLRQAAQEAQRQVRLDIEGGEVEIDRGVLERMTPAFEHLLRNAVAHGIEPPAERFMRGKPTEGRVLLRLAQEGAQVSVSCSDDGRGLDLQRIQRRAVERGLLALEAQPDAAALQHLVFAPGFSTAEQLSPLAGRGVGLDVVRAEVEALGGHIVLETTPGQGSRFTLQLPLTTAVMQVLLLRCGEATVAVPAALVDEVLRVPAAEARQAAARGRFGAGIEAPVFHRLEPLLQQPLPPDEAPERMVTVLLLRGAQQRLALQVQEVLGRQEAVLKPLGPQLATLPGLAGMSLLPSGLPLPVYNPAALALRHTAAQQAAQVGGGAAWGPGAGSVAAALAPAPAAVDDPAAPLVLVVDDSLTVRRATQRLLEREGYRVALAKDGVEALALLEQEPPALVLTDLEMPRLDGFELLRRLRAEPRWQALPVIVITSRRASRHRELAASLGVEHYLGKPCAQETLLALVAGYSPALQAPN